MSSRFNPSVALLFNEAEVPPFLVQSSISLALALSEKRVDAQSRFFLATIENKAIALPILAMIHHHVAQGKADDVDWVASFCALCNAGSIFSANLDGQIYHFAAQGYYDAMTLLADKESQTYWNHLTGKALHGKLAGKELKLLGSLVEMRCEDILKLYPEAELALDSLSEQDLDELAAWDTAERLQPKPSWDSDAELVRTLSGEDMRLPRHEMGLGIWTARVQRYYPVLQLYRHHNLVVDTFNGRRIIVYIDPHVGLPMASYCEAKSAEWHGDVIHFSDGQELRRGMFYRNGQAVLPERPRQNVIRWHGFSALFPNCEIYR